MGVAGKARAGFWIGIAVSSAMLVAASRMVDSSVAAAVLFLGGVAGFAATFIVRAFAMKRVAQELAARNERRLEELERHILSSGLAVEVSGASGLFAGLGAAAFAAVAAYMAYREPDVFGVACAAFFIFLTAVLLPPGLAQRGKPLLRITRHGVDIGLYGTYAWHEIGGIDVQEIRHRGIRLGHQLVVHVPDLGKFLERMHPTTRIWYARFRFGESRNKLQLILNDTSESPEVIRDLLQSLWWKAMGLPAEPAIERPMGR
jgi:hypothetical protein